MERNKKSLLYMYVADYCGFVDESFNFDLCDRYAFSEISGIPTVRKSSDNLDPEYWRDAHFFGPGISALTLLIGENGAGKTSLFRLLLTWLCKLAKGEIPNEIGVLIFRDGNIQKGIGFRNNREWDELKFEDCPIEKINVENAKAYLREISVVYYTDTMTDLELPVKTNKDFLIDYSLLNRLEKVVRPKERQGSWSGRQQRIIDRIDFLMQIQYLFSLDHEHLDRFPLHYIKFKWEPTELNNEIPETIKKQFRVLQDNTLQYARECHDGRVLLSILIEQVLIGLVNAIFSDLPVFGGTDDSICPYIESGVASLKGSLVGKTKIQAAADFVINIKNTYASLFPDDDSLIDVENTCLDCEKLITASLPLWNEDVTVFDSWQLQDEIMTMSLQDWVKQFNVQAWADLEIFFRAYCEATPILPNCWFDWQYPSSGEANLCNLFACISIARRLSDNTIWYFMDEPDNAFHPQWKRNAIDKIIEHCSEAHSPAQIWITTHSPIMLSDVPKQAAVFLQRNSEIGNPKNQFIGDMAKPFAQQIYRLFNDSFFLTDGVIGMFAEKKISSAFAGLMDPPTKPEDKDAAEKEVNRMLSIIDEPILRGVFKEWLK